jgi:hypothetical protein
MEIAEMKKCRAIVMFGPATPTSGTRAGVYYQVTIDPSMVSPNGEYIRFGATQNDEIQGWQRIEALTVCEILGEYNADGAYPEPNMKPEPLLMMVIK